MTKKKPASEAFLSVRTTNAQMRVEPGQTWWKPSEPLTTCPTKMRSKVHKKNISWITRKNRPEGTRFIFLQSEGQIGHICPCH
jgi:hypothetical protein